ncbi:MAG: AzlD domain-containing protein [Oceanibaculum nanhaiense]|uniref:AzlD domain-containing protein n=1 Tax=Oceanibaculum nanhaiense TaxID=1909734 RepID=UPI0025A437AE|nr:AzlD domain-containing protein [Oceanibaculum nanhaiense]MDM7945370.1 AzlD domain-containing protein [Oceanibaculum nanhaiense]
MAEALGTYWPYFVVVAGGLVTYGIRVFGVALAGRISVDSQVFQWVGCIAYGLLAALIARMILLPVGVLQEAPTAFRIAGAVVALAAFFLIRRNVFAGCIAGVGTLIALTAIFGLD